MEQLISDIEPPRDRVFDDLARELREGHVVPLLMGSATGGHGVTRLLKAVRHEAPGVTQTRARLGVEAEGPALAQVIRTIHTAHGGKLSLARVLRGAFADGAGVISSRGNEERIAGARAADRRGLLEGPARRGGRHRRLRPPREPRRPATASADNKKPPEAAAAVPPPPATQAIAIHVKDRKDEVRLAAALAKLCEEDPALAFVQDQESGELKLYGPGRDAPARDRRAARRRASASRSTSEQALGRLSRDDSRRGDGARAPQEAVGRPRPVRRRAGRGRARASAARASPSPSACTAARCRASIFPPSRWARATR